MALPRLLAVRQLDQSGLSVHPIRPREPSPHQGVTPNRCHNIPTHKPDQVALNDTTFRSDVSNIELVGSPTSASSPRPAGTRTGRGCVRGCHYRSGLPCWASSFGLHFHRDLSEVVRRRPRVTTTLTPAVAISPTPIATHPKEEEPSPDPPIGDAPAFGDEAIANPLGGSSDATGRVPWQRFAYSSPSTAPLVTPSDLILANTMYEPGPEISSPQLAPSRGVTTD